MGVGEGWASRAGESALFEVKGADGKRRGYDCRAGAARARPGDLILGVLPAIGKPIAEILEKGDTEGSELG